MGGTPTIIAGIAREMKHLAQRQQVVAQNIANSETSNYKAKDLTAPNFAALLAQHGGGGATGVARPQVEITSGMAALGARRPRGGGVVLDHDISETKPDGNNVTLEDQLLKMGQIQGDFAAMTNLYRKHQALLKTALGKG